MHDFSENEFLTDLLKSAAKAGIGELYLFSVNDHLFVTYVQEGAAPRTEVFKGAGGVLRTLRGTMESDVAPGSEPAPEQEWCLDLGKAHFDMSTGGLVLVRIIASRTTGVEPRGPAPAPPSPSDDADQVIDEEALAAAWETEPEDLGGTPKPQPPPPPADDEQALDEDALAAALVNEEPADPVEGVEPPPEDEARSTDNVLTAVHEPARDVSFSMTKPVPQLRVEAPSPDNVLTAVHEPVRSVSDEPQGPPPPPPDEERSLDDALAAVFEPEQDVIDERPNPVPPPPAGERSLEDVLAAALEPLPEPIPPARPPAPAKRDAAPPPPPPAEKTPLDRAREMVGAILLGNKPFPSQAVKTIPIHLTVQGRFVPVWYEGGKLWVAVNGPSPVGSLLAQDVETIEVDAHKLQELLTCYRIDPRHKKR